MELNKPEYLTAILMKNNKGKSPIDITIDNESPRNEWILLELIILNVNGGWDSYNGLYSGHEENQYSGMPINLITWCSSWFLHLELTYLQKKILPQKSHGEIIIFETDFIMWKFK